VAHRDDEPSESDGDQVMEVDATLEDDIAQVVAAVDAFLRQPDAAQQQALLATLEHLDAQIARSDEYHSTLSARTTSYNMTSMYQVFGETSRNPVVDQVLGPTLHAQVDLVKAAKNVVRTPTPAALELLRTARTALP
jgi:hypothetical protein